jgi:hypothetical protein
VVAGPGQQSNHIAMQCNNNYNGNGKGGGLPQQGGLPKEGKICKEDQDKEEGSVSVKEVRRTAIQVDDGNAVFLLMVKETVATMIMLLSTIATRASLLLGAEMTTIIPGLLLP